MALGDKDYDVRSKTIEFLTAFFIEGEGDRGLLITGPSQLTQSAGHRLLSLESIIGMEETILSLFDKGIKDKHPSPRKSWIKFVDPYIKDGMFTSSAVATYHLPQAAHSLLPSGCLDIQFGDRRQRSPRARRSREDPVSGTK